MPFETVPFQDPILVFAVAMVVFLIAPLLFEKYRLPGIIGIIVFGVIIGPNGLGLLDRTETFVLLGEVGLVYLMFLAGLEIDLGQFVEHRDQSLVFGTISFLFPQTVGMLAGIYLLGFDLLTAALFAAIFSSHTLLAYPVVNRLGIVDNEAVTATIGGTILTDTAALLVLAIVIGGVEGDLTVGFWLMLAAGLVALFAGTWLLVPRIGRWFFRNIREESYYEFLFVMAVLFIAAVFAEVTGLKHIIGAFIAGLALNRLTPQTGTLMNRIEFVGNALLIPFFLFSVGMLVNPGVIVSGPETLGITVTIVAVILGTKLLASWSTGAMYGFTLPEELTMFGLSTGQAAAALAITIIGFDELGLFDETIVNAVILMILVMSFVSPAVSNKYGRRIIAAEADTEYDPSDAPTRVLVPIADPKTMEGLLDFGMLIRETAGETEPLRVLAVVHRRSRVGAGDEALAVAVADAEERLETAEEHVASAEVPVETITRVAASVPRGIARTVQDERITTVVLGQSPTGGLGNRFFGTTQEQVLDQITQLVIVIRIRSPLNVVDRVVCVLPPRVASNPGFYESVHVVKTVANQLGLPLACYVAGKDPERYARLIEGVEPTVTLSVDVLPVGTRFEPSLAEVIEPTDFVLGLSPRHGGRGWDDTADQLPRVVNRSEAENVAIAYLSETDTGDRRRFLQMR